MAHTLADEIQSFVADTVRVGRLMDRALELVEVLHECGEVHAHLHPRNFLVDDSDRITLEHRAMPMEEYAAPEAVVTRASNIYSMGMILRGLLAGRPTVEAIEQTMAMATSAAPSDRVSTILGMRDEVSRMTYTAASHGRWLRAFTPADARERELLAACSDPDARLVYADWLEQQGSESRAAFLREEALGPVEEAPWRALVARSPVIGCATTCPQAWDLLDRIGIDNIRRCPGCNRTAFYCATIESAMTMLYWPMALDVTVDHKAVTALRLARERYTRDPPAYAEGAPPRQANVLTRLWGLFRRR